MLRSFKKNIFKFSKRRSIAILLLGIFFFQIPVAQALIPRNHLRENFPQMVANELCYSALPYSLDMQYAEAHERFQKETNCLFNDAMAQSVNLINADFKQKWAEIPSNLNFEDIEPPEECSLAQTIATQVENGYQSICPTAEYNPTIDKFYSTCMVTETIMNEFCGYQEYLEWKNYDDFKSEGIFESKDYYTFNERRQNLELDHKAEIKRTYEALDEALYRYQKWEQNYRLHMWLITIWEALKKTQAMTTILRKAIYHFPDKFNFASSELCDQY